MNIPMWVTGVVLASSLSLVVTLIRRWRQRLRAEAKEEAARLAAAAKAKRAPPLPPFGASAPATTRAPPYELIVPPSCDGGLLAWWQRLDGTTTFWLCRGAGGAASSGAGTSGANEGGDNQDGGAWWVTWFSPWRRGLPERLWIGRDVPMTRDGHVELGPGLRAAWRGQSEAPALLDDARIWQDASLCGLDIELVQFPNGIGLKAAGDRIRDRFDLGSLASLAAMIEARISDGVAPRTWDVAAVQLRMTAPNAPDADTSDADLLVWGDLPPFGGLAHAKGQWRFEARGARSGDGHMVDLWPHNAVVVPLRAQEAAVVVRLDDGSEAELHALDGRGQELLQAMGMTP